MFDVSAVVARVPAKNPMETLTAALAGIEHAADLGRTTGERALLAGYASDRVGYAVLGGYDAAVRKLLAPLVLPRASFCVTEGKTGAHPRYIETRLEQDEDDGRFYLTGTKSFATLAAHAATYIVIATTGRGPDGKNLLRTAIVERGAPGITLRDRGPLPFAPEIPHASLELTRTPASRVLEGDAYELQVKPFRTVEDAHVTLAVCAYAFAEARAHDWPSDRLVASLTTLLSLADESDPTSPITHLALDTALDNARASLDALPWSTAPSEVAERWQRDRPILEVASSARRLRAEKARAAVIGR